MYIFPAIDLYDGKAVRLYKGDYAQMTVYSENPIEIARDFEAAGAKFIHMVDLEGARDGSTPNLSIVADVAQNTSLFVEIGGGIRDMDTVEKYLSAGVSRVILGTAAVNNEAFLREAVAKHGERIAVGADVKDGYIAIKGWLEKSAYTLEAFMEKMQALGVRTVICTDISKDGAMKGTNRQLYRDLSRKFSMDIVASGGVSDMEDIRALTAMNLYGAIIGKAYYTGAINLAEAISAAEGKETPARSPNESFPAWTCGTAAWSRASILKACGTCPPPWSWVASTPTAALTSWCSTTSLPRWRGAPCSPTYSER